MMTRKVFIADVAAMAERCVSGAIPSVNSVSRGTEDGELAFCYTPASGRSINIHILATDVTAYPDENTFFLYTDSQNVPKAVNDVLERQASFSMGLRIAELILQTARELEKALADGSRNNPFNIEDEEERSAQADQMAVDDESDDEGSEFAWPQSPTHDLGGDEMSSGPSYIRIAPEAAAMLDERIREDLRAVRNAGFKVGILRGMKSDSQQSVLSISVQVAQLGLSDEAILAWDLQKQQHVVLLMRYSAGYKTFDAIISGAARSNEIEFRIGVSKRYKPTVPEAMAAFTVVSKAISNDTLDGPAQENPQSQFSDSLAGFNSLFISSSLNEFMNQQFISLLKIRHSLGVGWDGAKRYYSEKQGRVGDADDGLSGDYYSESTSTQNRLPALAIADHLLDSKGDRYSFPLISVQFLMRYLTRCTEFCLVCHDRTQDSFEALKPYVCSKPLCLYQYMSLGFGPSVEHEILTQPYVVDLLISFCYASAKNNRLRAYPTGMSLSVPPLTGTTSVDPQYYGFTEPVVRPQPSTTTRALNESTDSYIVKHDNIRHEVIFEQDKPCPLRRGDWVVLGPVGDVTSTHHRVVDVILPTVRLSAVSVTRCSSSARPQVQNAIVTNNTQTLDANARTIRFHGALPEYSTSTSQAPAMTPATTPPLSNPVPVNLAIYKRNFDELDEHQKAESIILLLETIPSVKEMRSHLKQQQHLSEPSLRTWVDRISPAALGLLRWIIASNRSCIVQVDKCPGQDDADVALNSSRLDERVSNMDGWLQFRFAQGAPDKEHRFNRALEDTQGRHNPLYPTLFAWHGSGLQNWHSIIRTGLDFKDTMNGRAYGHGCYHSLDFATSAGYSNYYHSTVGMWPGSELKISSALCLNEIVNAPQEYISRTPHLVVQHIDWIQCRYLFVKVGNTSHRDDVFSTTVAPDPEKSSRQVAEIAQDMEFTPKGTNGKPIGIPRTAFPASREFRLKDGDRVRSLFSERKGHFLQEEEIVSDTEDVDDLAFLFSDNEAAASVEKVKENGKGKGKGRGVEDVVRPDSPPRKRTKSLTDFVPGSLDQSTLKILEPPAYATSSATQTLNRELKAILKVQDNTPSHELGWYIDRNVIQNVYQWIVELHSFDASLPLSKDMKNAGIKSVVLEIRFGKDYPMSPPFIRIIRPRFLPFMMGGGGHVTAGGAMCMELLTNSGWTAVSSLEGVLLQVRMAISNLEPKPARLEVQGVQHQRDYGVGEAMDAYVRACRTHGWEVPKDFKDFGGAEGGVFGY